MPKFLSNVDFTKKELQNAVFQNLASAPSSPLDGQVYYDTTDDTLYARINGAWVDLGGGGSGDVVGPAASVDSEIALFDGTTGKLLKRMTGSGLVKVTSGVASIATAGTDYVTASSTNTFTNKTIDANGTGNSITNLETADFAANVIDTDGTLAANSDTRLATQKAVKTYADGLLTGLAWKAPVRAATTANITLASGAQNGSVIDGVTLATNDRILLAGQSTATENGVYTVNASGAPTRAADADTGAEFPNLTVSVREGTVNADKVFSCTNDGTITLGSTNLVFVETISSNVPAASTTTAGKVELATQAETEAKSSSTLAVTPAGLATFPRKATATIGDGSSTTLSVTHNFNTADVIVQARQASDDAVVYCDIDTTGPNAVSLSFGEAPASNAIKVVVIG